MMRLRIKKCLRSNFSSVVNSEISPPFLNFIGNPLHQGCHDLIRCQKAQLITTAEDLIKGMGWESQARNNGVQKKLFVELNAEEKIIFDVLKTVPHESLDNIAIATRLPISRVAILLLKLEMKGCVNPLPGKFFEWA